MQSYRFRERLTALLERDQLTQQQLATASGLAQSTISHYLRGTRALPRAEELLALARHFGVTMEWLLGVDDVILPTSLAADVKAVPAPDNAALLQVVDSLHEQVERLRQLVGGPPTKEPIRRSRSRSGPSS